MVFRVDGRRAEPAVLIAAWAALGVEPSKARSFPRMRQADIDTLGKSRYMLLDRWRAEAHSPEFASLAAVLVVCWKWER